MDFLFNVLFSLSLYFFIFLQLLSFFIFSVYVCTHVASHTHSLALTRLHTYLLVLSTFFLLSVSKSGAEPNETLVLKFEFVVTLAANATTSMNVRS